MRVWRKLLRGIQRPVLRSRLPFQSELSRSRWRNQIFSIWFRGLFCFCIPNGTVKKQESFLIKDCLVFNDLSKIWRKPELDQKRELDLFWIGSWSDVFQPDMKFNGNYILKQMVLSVLSYLVYRTWYRALYGNSRSTCCMSLQWFGVASDDVPRKKRRGPIFGPILFHLDWKVELMRTFRLSTSMLATRTSLGHNVKRLAWRRN